MGFRLNNGTVWERKQTEPGGSFDYAGNTQIPLQIFVQIMFRINLLLSASRANMYLPKGKTKKNGGNGHGKKNEQEGAGLPYKD